MQMAAKNLVDWANLRRSQLEKILQQNLEGEVRFDPASRVLYSTDASIYQIEPIGVVLPKTKADFHRAVAIAMEQGVPIIPRGAGTSLSGQTVGPGLVIDASKYLCRILETNVAEGWARVEPGVVLGQLNRHLAPMGCQFGPDVATSDRATLGGMIGNNSAGSRSIRYGKTVDHVRELEVVLANGQWATFGPLDRAALAKKMRQQGREAAILRAVDGVVREQKDEIIARFPKIHRRVSGYNLDELLPPQPFNLAKLIVGSEGTLAAVGEATIQIVRSPKSRSIGVVHCATLAEALAGLDEVLRTGPSAIELIDQMVLDLARRSALYRDRINFIDGRPAAVLVVEYLADDDGEVAAGLDRLELSVRDRVSGPILRVLDKGQCEHVWNVRKTALPLLMSLPGAKKPIAFVEDTAVAPEKLPEFVARFRDILDRHGTDGSFYGHASVGCLHIRPLIDLRRADGVQQMADIASEVVDLVVEFGGAMSGEHGDGLARSRFNEKLFGETIYRAFQEIKGAFDPENLMNPGKIVDGPLMTESLREATVTDRPLATATSFVADGGIMEVAARCNGNALCRRDDKGVMCPSFMATREEMHGPRGRANLFRAAFEGRLGAEGPRGWATAELEPALDLCLGCKACKTECPSNVDIARLKSEFLHQRHLRSRPSFFDRMVADLPRQSALASKYAPFSNWLARSWPARWMMDRFVGLDRRRPLPWFHRNTLLSWFRKHASAGKRLHGNVVLLADCFTNYHDPAVGRDAVFLLEKAGYQVTLAPICCGRVLISKGFLDEARRLVETNVPRLLPYAEDGVVILGMEPSCLFTLVDEWRDLLPGEATSMIARQARLVETWLDQRAQWGGADLPAPRTAPLEVLLHGHCHQKAAGGVDGTVSSLRRLAGVEPVVLDAGCCGMAGSFGYEKTHYDLSVTIAEQRLLPALRRAPAACVVAPGFSCRSQIIDLAHRRAIHPVQLIRRRIEDDSPA